MDRETVRRIEEYRRNEAGPIENNLIDELVGGEMDRTEFLRRGTMFGLSVGMMGSLLGLVGEAGAAPVARATRRPSRPAARSASGSPLRRPARAVPAQRRRLARVRGHPGRVPHLHEPQGDRSCRWLATSWKPNKDATVWTFQLRKGVKFHNGQEMTSTDVVASMKQYVGEGLERRASAPFFDPPGVSAGRPVRGRLPAQVARSAPSRTSLSQTTYQAIIQPAAIAAKPGTWVKSGMIGTGAFKLKSYTTKQSAELVRNTALLGRPTAARRGQGDVLHGLGAARARASGGADRPRDAALAAGGAAVQEQLEVHVLLAAGLGASPVLHADRPRRRSRTPASGGPSRSTINRPAADREGRCSARPWSGTTTRSGSTSPRPTRRRSSGRRTSQLAKSLLGRRGGREPQVHHHDAELPRPPRPRGVDPGVRAGGRDHVGLEVMDGRQVLRLRAGGRGLRHDDAVAEPPVLADRVRLARRAEPLPLALLHVDG